MILYNFHVESFSIRATFSVDLSDIIMTSSVNAQSAVSLVNPLVKVNSQTEIQIQFQITDSVLNLENS